MAVSKPANGRSETSTRESRPIAELERELAQTSADRQAIREEHEATNEEFQAANEELQSANEELETSKEELESTNEESHYGQRGDDQSQREIATGGTILCREPALFPPSSLLSRKYRSSRKAPSRRAF